VPTVLHDVEPVADELRTIEVYWVPQMS